MSVEQIETQVLALPPDERRRFAQWFFDHEAKILDADSDKPVHAPISSDAARPDHEALSGVPSRPTGFVRKWSGTARKTETAGDPWLARINAKHLR